MEPNKGHYSKEIFLAPHSSHILPKGSPLMVGLVARKSSHFLTILKLVFFTAWFSRFNNMAKGHWDIEQVKGQCDQPANAHPTPKSAAQSAPYPETTGDHGDNPRHWPLRRSPGVSR